MAVRKRRVSVPPEWADLLASVPEKHSARILASVDQDSFARYAMCVNPVFSDPTHGLLSLAERELIGVVVSAINACVTCLIIHEYNLGQCIGDHSRARRIAINYRTVGLSAQERAVADFAVKVTEQPGRLEPADLQDLRDAGLTEMGSQAPGVGSSTPRRPCSRDCSAPHAVNSGVGVFGLFCHFPKFGLFRSIPIQMPKICGF